MLSYRPGLQFAGVLANRVGSVTHARMLRDSLPEGMVWFGALARDEAYALPSRHLGLTQAGEVADLEQRIERAAQALGALAPPLPGAVRFYCRWFVLHLNKSRMRHSLGWSMFHQRRQHCC